MGRITPRKQAGPRIVHRPVSKKEVKDTDLVSGLVEAKAIIKRIEAGELCVCNRWLTMPGCRLCKFCAVKEFLN